MDIADRLLVLYSRLPELFVILNVAFMKFCKVYVMFGANSVPLYQILGVRAIVGIVLSTVKFIDALVIWPNTSLAFIVRFTSPFVPVKLVFEFHVNEV